LGGDMNEIVAALYFIPLGFLGAYAHYFKKRHGDHTTKLSLRSYLFNDFNATIITIGAVIFAELTLASTVSLINLSSIVAAICAGYTSDSVLNKTNKI
jgi:hypothetical protein